MATREASDVGAPERPSLCVFFSLYPDTHASMHTQLCAHMHIQIFIYR